MVDVDEAGVHAVVKEITANGGKAKGIVADLREDANARRIVRETANAFGGLDFVWNHLGHPGPASVEGIEMADFALAVDLNLRPQIVTTEAAPPELRARGGGSLLYTASTLGLVAGREGRYERLGEVGEEAFTIDQAVEDARCGHAVVSLGGEEGQRPPEAMRHGCAQWHTAKPRSRDASNSACSVSSGVCDSWPGSQSRPPSSGYGCLP